ncbi:hypothetical protein Ctha_1291 [Chloroherpeton thalassium ATCC 35110]|uniref:Uncharacterized protein n=1 Tax=Chloroherpeton thalassium (strain ATCC 35110 / GB-78) TaxID=517418 RepID=B3QZ61_CHLT3|nr:hypothetical protein [Chloroherpeton thalassium]ACF13754.1 hypothetical protein Ctha_1291 [Chloroherpeton thalassium ATCC 35110]
MIFRSKIHLVAKEFWRLLEVYLFLVISVLGGQAIAKNTYLLSSKSKDKTAETRLLLSRKALLTYPLGLNIPASSMARSAHYPNQDARAATAEKQDNSDSHGCAFVKKHFFAERSSLSTSVPFLQNFAQLFQVQFASPIAYIPQRLKTPFNLIQINTPLLT